MKKHLFLIIALVTISISIPQYSNAGWLKSLVRSVVGVVTSVVNRSAGVLNSVLNVFTNCDDSSVDGIATKCFNGEEISKIQAGVNALKTRNYAFAIGGRQINAYEHFKNHTSRFVNWDSRQMRLTYVTGYAAGCDGDNKWGCHTVDGTTFLTALGLSLSDAKMSGLLVHEASHFDRAHNCGDSSDQDLNGPYGFEAIYLMSVARNNEEQNLPASEKALALSRAVSIANYQLCNNATAKDQVLNYKNNEVSRISNVSTSSMQRVQTTRGLNSAYYKRQFNMEE